MSQWKRCCARTGDRSGNSRVSGRGADTGTKCGHPRSMGGNVPVPQTQVILDDFVEQVIVHEIAADPGNSAKWCVTRTSDQ